MKLIRKTRREITKKGNKIRYALFKCPDCLQEVERQISNGLRDKSCGCIRYKLMAESNTGKKRTEEQRQKYSEANKGKKRTEEQRNNISKGKKGMKLSEEHSQNIAKSKQGENNPMYGKIPWNKDKKCPEISEKMKGENNPMYGIHRFGEDSPNWNNGSSFEPYGIEFNKQFKKFIKDRDFNICQNSNCLNTENLHVHHIDYDKTNNNPKNLITLCHSCHMKTNGKSNRNYFTKYYQNIVLNTKENK